MVTEPGMQLQAELPRRLVQPIAGMGKMNPFHILARIHVGRVPRAPLRLVESVAHRQAACHRPCPVCACRGDNSAAAYPASFPRLPAAPLRTASISRRLQSFSSQLDFQFLVSVSDQRTLECGSECDFCIELYLGPDPVVTIK